MSAFGEPEYTAEWQLLQAFVSGAPFGETYAQFEYDGETDVAALLPNLGLAGVDNRIHTRRRITRAREDHSIQPSEYPYWPQIDQSETLEMIRR